MSLIKEHKHNYFLTAGECNAEQEMPLTLIAQRVIEVATEHANILGVGYADLIKDNEAWVLSRLTIEMIRYPRVNENYTFTTWIEGYNRHYSERNMDIVGEDGEILGYVRTIWVAINIETRTAADISKFAAIAATISDRPCPIEKQSRMRPLGDNVETYSHRFRYSDIDFNRHVNSVKYMEAILNLWDLEHYDLNYIKRFEIAYLHETHYNDKVKIKILQDDNVTNVEICNETETTTRAKIIFEARK